MTDNKMEKLTRIAELLLERTSQGRLEWEETAEEDTFLTSMGTTSASIHKNTNWSPARIELAIFNDKGRIVETADFDFGEPLGGPSEGTMGALYDAARRNALGTDDVLDNALRALGSEATPS